MKLLELLGVFGGLALFLHGMQMMSSGLEAAAGNRMKTILERLTANRFMGILVGALITTAVQSSSATTVMVVGFVNAGMMTLNQAVWIIMGANVGTTVTGLMIALDVGAMAPVVAFAGVFLMVFVKKARLQHIGQILAGLGILFNLLAALLLISVLAEKFTRGTPIDGWASLMCVILCASGIIMLMLGILGEYIWRTLDAARTRPPYIVDEVLDTKIGEDDRETC